MQELYKRIEEIKNSYKTALKKASNLKEIQDFKIHFLGKKGSISALLAEMKNLSIEDKRVFGPLISQLKTEAELDFDLSEKNLVEQQLQKAANKEKYFDVTAYKNYGLNGHIHPYTQIIEEMENIFISMGYEVLDGFEVDSEFYNFSSLNIPETHPARDMYDTFWLDKAGMLLRTHTSNMQIRAMQTKQLPIAVINPGRCFRHEATDATHDYMFMQCEGFLIAENITLANLFATARKFLEALFKKDDIKIRIRPGFFPFVEPGVEIDMQCPFCSNGCSVCKKSTWIEVFPGGLIHPNVLLAGGIDPEKYSGFAFGFGLTRLAMIKYGINDIRLLHSGKMKFLEQF